MACHLPGGARLGVGSCHSVAFADRSERRAARQYDALRLRRVLQQRQGCCKRRLLLLTSAGRSERPPHEVRRQNEARQAHGGKAILEWKCSDDHGGDAGRFQETGDVSHGHVAYRSDRDEHNSVDLLIPESLHPPGPRSLEQGSLGTGADKGIGVGRQLADCPVARKVTQQF